MVDDELRLTRWKLKQANKTIGRQGQTIYGLRGELAVTRELHGKIERGDIRSLERQVESLTADLEKSRDGNKKLREELSKLREVVTRAYKNAGKESES